MAIRLFIDNNYTEHIVSDILNRQHKALVLSSTINRLILLSDKVMEHIERVFGEKYKRVVHKDDIYIETPISKLYMMPPIEAERIRGSRVNSIIVDDFTNIPKTFLTEIVAGYCASSPKVDLNFYTNDTQNLQIYSWLSDYSN